MNKNFRNFCKGLAMVVTVDDYNYLKKTEKSIKDGLAIENMLEKLRFNIFSCYNADVEEMDKCIEEFKTSAEEYDNLFIYFAGHSIYLDGYCYLLSKDASAENCSSIKRHSIELGTLLSDIHNARGKNTIVVVDTSRCSPFVCGKGIGSHVYQYFKIPQNCLVAFSSSPNEYACENNIGDNSLYVDSLVSYVFKENISIEELLKKVRQLVINKSHGIQTPWEINCLTNSLCMNSGQYDMNDNIEYSHQVLAPKNATFSDATFMNDLWKDYLDDSNGFSNVNDIVRRFRRKDVSFFSKDDLFLMGRIIINAAGIGALAGMEILGKPDYIKEYSIDGAYHLLNGMFFQIYFDFDGMFKDENILSYMLDNVFKILQIPEFISSFIFLNKVLEPYKDRLLFVPSLDATPITFEICFKTVEWMTYTKEKYKTHDIYSIMLDGKELVTDRCDGASIRKEDKYDNLSLEYLKWNLGVIYKIPSIYINIVTNEPIIQYPMTIRKKILKLKHLLS